MRFSVAALLTIAVHVEAASLADVRLRLTHRSDTSGRLYVGEPLALVATTVNDGTEPLAGQFKAFPYGQKAAFHVRPRGGPSFRIDQPFDPYEGKLIICAVSPSFSLNPGESLSSQAQFLLDPRTRVPWLAHEGRYEVVATLRPWGTDAKNAELRSKPLRIEVVKVPQALQSAYDAYRSSGLMEFVTDPVGRMDVVPGSEEVAESYLARFPSAPFSRYVRDALRQGLMSRINDYRRLTSSQSAMWSRLFEPGRPH